MPQKSPVYHDIIPLKPDKVILGFLHSRTKSALVGLILSTTGIVSLRVAIM